MGVELKALIEQALTESGGVQYLKRLADEQPQSFATLLGKILPRDVNATVKGDMVIHWALPKCGLDE